MVQFNNFLITLDGYLSGSWWFPILLVGTGIFFTIYLGFPQFKFFGKALNLVSGKNHKQDADGETSGNPSRGLWSPLTILVQFEIISFDSKTLVITGFAYDFMMVYELYWSAYVCLYKELYYICTIYELKQI